MKQKILILLFATLVGTGLTQASVVIDGIAYVINETKNAAAVTSGGTYTGEVVIPATITYNAKSYSVVSIGVDAFYKCGKLTSITMGNSVTSIGGSAFDGCSSLTSITIPNSVTSIGVAAFGGCTGLTSMVVASENTKYDSRDCNAIIETSSNTLIAGCKNTIIPNSVTSIGAGAFQGCNSLTSITIPSSVTSIGNSAFANCQGLTSITIPSSVTSIGANAFYNHYGSNITDVYCYPNAANLTWNESGCNDFIRQGDKTVCHVFASELTAYQTKFTGQVNVTFVGDLTGSCGVTANLADGAYWATFYSNLGNYQAPEGTRVFAVNLTGTTITMIPVEDRIVKSGEGVVLKQETTSSEPTTTTITMTLTATTPTGNFSNNSLQGTMTDIENPDYGHIYVLNNPEGGNGVGFYKLASDGTIGANKAYLTYSGALARQFFLFDETTGIVELKNSRIEELKSDDAWYTLDGRKLDGKPTTKGLYIVNGKKVIK